MKEATAEYETIEISAREGINLEDLLNEIEENLPYKMKKCEYLIPDTVFKAMKENYVRVKVIPTTAKWQGITYKED